MTQTISPTTVLAPGQDSPASVWTPGTLAILRQLRSDEGTRQIALRSILCGIVELSRRPDVNSPELLRQAVTEALGHQNPGYCSALITIARWLFEPLHYTERMQVPVNDYRVLYCAARAVRDGVLPARRALKEFAGQNREGAQAHLDALLSRVVNQPAVPPALNPRVRQGRPTPTTPAPTGQYDTNVAASYNVAYQRYVAICAPTKQDEPLERLAYFLANAPVPLLRAVYVFGDAPSDDIQAFMAIVKTELGIDDDTNG